MTGLSKIIDEALTTAPVDHWVTQDAADQLIGHLVRALYAAGYRRADGLLDELIASAGQPSIYDLTDVPEWLGYERERLLGERPAPASTFSRPHDYSGGAGRCRACGVTRREGVKAFCTGARDVQDHPDGSGA